MYLFQKDDGKARAWSGELAGIGIAVSSLPGSPLWAPLQLVVTWLRRQNVSGYVFRYLNDYPSLWKTVFRLLTESATIALVRATRGRVFWIAHNVDRESDRHHPRISAARRALVCRAADTIFVLDPLLVPHARRAFPAAQRIDWVCFGAPEPSVVNADTLEVRDAIRQLRARLQARHPVAEVRIGICVSSPAPKCTHFLSATTFVDRCTSPDMVVGVVVVGHIARMTDRQYAAARRRMSEHDQIVLIDRAADVREEHLAGDVEFFYRSMDDHSVPFSLYVAASVARPVITEAGTFLAEMVATYELGAVGPESSTDREGQARVRDLLERWDGTAAERFLAMRNWSVAAERFAAGFRLHGTEPGATRPAASTLAGQGAQRRV